MSDPHRDPIVIVSAARTPIGGMLGDFASLTASDLGAVAIQAAVDRAGVPADAINEVLMGNCLMAGQGQAPARQALRKAGLPDSAGAVTLSKMCGSGMRAMMLAHDMLAAGSADVMVAGGMESMTNAPHLVFARKGVRYGATQLFDHMAMDGLEDAYERGKAMGVFAEACVAKYGFTREQQDQYAITSTTRALNANQSGAFDWEIAPVTIAAKTGETLVRHDEQPFKAKLDKIPGLKPAFKKDGTITAANASSISDGAAALVMMRESSAHALGARPVARVVAHAACPGAGVVQHRTGGLDRKGAQAGGLEREGCGLVGGQRGLCGGDDGGNGRVQTAARHRQRAWRRLRSRSSHRGLRRTHRGHAVGGPPPARAPARRGVAVHWWWRGHCPCAGDDGR